MLSTRATMVRTAFTTSRLAHTNISSRFKLSTSKALFSTSNANVLRQARFERFKEYSRGVGLAAGWVGVFWFAFVYDCPHRKMEEHPTFGPTH